jgi:hypothetical protein
MTKDVAEPAVAASSPAKPVSSLPAPPGAVPPGPAPPTSSQRPLVLFFVAAAVLLVLLVVGVILVMRALFPAAPPTQLSVSGRLEGYQSDLGAKVGGRVVWVAVREGADVRAGQVLVQLDDAQARSQVGSRRRSRAPGASDPRRVGKPNRRNRAGRGTGDGRYQRSCRASECERSSVASAGGTSRGRRPTSASGARARKCRSDALRRIKPHRRRFGAARCCTTVPVAVRYVVSASCARCTRSRAA